MQEIAILIVNGFDRRNRFGPYNAREAIQYPWIDLCLRQIGRHSESSRYTVHVYDNCHLPEHRRLLEMYPDVIVHPHGSIPRIKLWLRQKPYQVLSPLRRVLSGHKGPLRVPYWELSHPAALDWLVAQLDDDVEYFVVLDSDSFPVRDGWLETLIGHLQNGGSLSGVYRDEMAPKITPFIHTSCLCMRTADFRSLPVSFSRKLAQDVGQNITIEMEKQHTEIIPLRRSNVRNFHFLMGGVYGGIVYHHGAGSRRAKFWTSRDEDAQEEDRIRVMLRDRAFEDLELLIEELTGTPYSELATAPFGC